MAVSTFDELKEAIADWLERNDVEARAEDWIMFAERQISRDLRSRQMIKRKFLTTTPDVKFYPLPNRFLQQRDFQLEVGNHVEPLFSATPKTVDSKRRSRTPGQPKFYAVHGNEFELSPVPDSAYRIEMTYYEKPIELSDSNQTNVFITEFPDLMLYAAMLNAEAYIMNDERIGLWSNAYKSIIDQENSNSKKGRYGVAPAMEPIGTMVV